MSTSKFSIVPAIIPTSDRDIDTALEPLLGTVSEVQVDIVDGAFVPFTSWPYRGDGTRGSFAPLSSLTVRLSVELDLMIEKPETVIDECLAAGVERFIIHMESTANAGDIIEKVHKEGRVVGLSLLNDTDLSVLDPFIDRIDFVQCMGIASIGTQGNPFDERVLARIEHLKRMHPHLPIAVDGSVNEKTLPRLLAAGATRFAVGSALIKSEDPTGAYRTLASLLPRE